MAVKCSKYGGYISDLSFGSKIDRHDCENHIKPLTDFPTFKRIHFDSNGRKI